MSIPASTTQYAECMLCGCVLYYPVPYYKYWEWSPDGGGRHEYSCTGCHNIVLHLAKWDYVNSVGKDWANIVGMDLRSSR